MVSYLERLTRFGRKVKIFVVKGPTYHYTYGRWRLKRWLGQTSVKSIMLDDQTFFAQLDLERPELSQVKKAVVEGDYKYAKTDVGIHFRSRTHPRFFFELGAVEQSILLIADDQKEATIHAADEIRQDTFHFRGVGPVKFQDSVDWTYCPQGNIDWTWDLNRHAYFDTLGRAYWYTDDERYAQKFQELLLDWLANNPASANQSNWSSVFEAAFRINTWIWAFHYFRSSAAFDNGTCLAFLKGLLAHGCYLDANLELHIQNNHLLLEAKTLAMLGLLFPEFKRAEKWRRRGLKIFYQQIRAQVCSDGVHGERATHYHRVVAGELLELLVLLENNNIPIPAEVVEIFDRMVEFELWVTKPDGSIPLFGDSALKDTHLRFSAASGGAVFLGRGDLRSVVSSLNEATVWLLGAERVKQYLDWPITGLDLNSRAFPEGGYFFMRSGQGLNATYVAFDCGPFGYKSAPNHGHADALSFELYAFGQTLLVDPGVYSTHLGSDWRNFFRGSRAHNTVVVDDRDQSVLLDTQRVYRPAQASLHQWVSNDHFDFVDGSHSGYERFPKSITHRRQIFFVKPEYWVVIDWLAGHGMHCFDLYFHLMPGRSSRLDPQSKSLYTGRETEPGLAIVPLAATDLQAEIITGAITPIQGWVSLFSGEKRPASVLRYRQETTAPVHFLTVLYPYCAGDQVSLTVSPLDVQTDCQRPLARSKLVGLQIKTDSHTDYLVIDQEPSRMRKSFVGYETDAQITYLRHRQQDQKLIKAITREGRQLLFQSQPLSRVNGFAGDSVLDCEGWRLDLTKQALWS